MKTIFAFLVMAGLAVNCLAQATPSADELWQRIQILKRQGPEKQKFESQEDLNTTLLAYLDSVDKACDAFLQEYPNDKRDWEAKVEKLRIDANRSNYNGKKIKLSEFESRVDELVNSSETSKPIKGEASFLMVVVRARSLIDEPQPNKLADFDKALDDFTATYPNDPNNHQLTTIRLEVYDKNDPAKAKQLLTQLASDPNPKIAIPAQHRLKMAELQSHPLTLKFTALDGTDFDITKWRGKVVLVDFWATWCGPCRAELPHVLDTYGKLHAKGFEIVGISLDDNKDKLQAFTKDKEMVWPQFFDGKGWENAISSGFGINSIPAMWLVDKKGIIRTTEAGENLEQAIQQLLSE